MVRFVTGVAVETVLERTYAHKLLERIKDVFGSDTWDADAGLLDPDYHLAMFRFREEHRISGVARRLKRGVDSGMNPGEVFSRVQDHVIAAAHAHVERLVLESFVDKVKAQPDGELKNVLNLLCDLHALSSIEADRAWFMEHGRLTSVRSKAISREVNGLLRQVRPIAGDLVRAFGVPREMLRAEELLTGATECEAPGLGGWDDDPLWAHFYDWSVEHRRLGGLAWRVGIQSDLQKLYAAAAEIGRQPAGARILDIPCGGGVALRGLKPGQGVEYVAADIAQTMLDRTTRAAERRGVADQVVPQIADVGDLPFDDDAFDLVVSFTGLHCFPDPALAVIEMVRVLKPGGVMTGSALLNDTGLHHEPMRRIGRAAGLLGPGCTGTQLVSWLDAQRMADVVLERSGAIGYFRGVKRSASVVGGNEPLERRVDLELGLGAADPVGALDGLAGLEVLVDLEEVLDLEAVELRHVVDVADVLHPRVAGRDAEDLVVAALLVGHAEHADGAAADQAAGEGRLLQQHQRVERVAVLAEGVLDVAVVGGVHGRGEEEAVEPHPTGLVVDFVLVPAPLGDLHEDVELQHFFLHSA